MSNEDSTSNFFTDLLDFRFRKYITRRVASIVYLGSLIFLPILTFTLTYAAYRYAQPFYLDGFHWQLLAIWIAGPIIGLLVLIYTRILIELNIAVVNIAENTESR
jgi:hypothetical protein